MKRVVYYSEILLFLSISLTLLIPNRSAATPVVVDTVEVAETLSGTAQRKMFYDTVNNQHWLFYFNGTEIEFAVSADGSEWRSVGSLPYATLRFSVTFREIGGAGYVFVAAEANEFDVVLRRGELSAGAVAFGDEVLVFDGNSDAESFSRPSIALDSTGKVWVAAVRDFGPEAIDNLQVVTTRSVDDGGVGSVTFADVVAVGRRSSSLEDIVIMPQSNGEMYLVVNNESGTLLGFRFRGGAWDEANEGGDAAWSTFDSGLNAQVKALTFYKGELHIGGSFRDLDGDVDADFIAR